LIKVLIQQKTRNIGLILFILLGSCSRVDRSQKHINMTTNFRASFCDPFKPDIIELGDIEKDEVIQKFENTPWADFLREMETAKEGEIFYSPSLEIENRDTKHGLAISAVGDPNQYEFYISYKRPKSVKTLFGKEKINEGYTSNKTGQTKQDALDCLNALLRNDTEYLANKIGQ
jgi:hypothetical protein